MSEAGIVTELLGLGRRYLALCEQEFAAAVADEDYGQADEMARESFGLHEALERQERASDEH